jgi:hypothetical protein
MYWKVASFSVLAVLVIESSLMLWFSFFFLLILYCFFYSTHGTGGDRDQLYDKLNLKGNTNSTYHKHVQYKYIRSNYVSNSESHNSSTLNSPKDAGCGSTCL